MRRRALLSGLFLLLVLPAALLAQQTTGTVKGTVVDLDGNPLGFIQVFLESIKPGRATLNVMTGDDGSFRFNGVTVDTYHLYAFQTGYASDRVENINVDPGATSTHIIRLFPDKKREEIIVVDWRSKRFESIEVEQTVQSSTLDAAAIERLPLQNRRIQDIVFTFAGVSRTGSSDSTEISVAGGTSAQIKYLLDGANFTDVMGGGPAGDVSSLAVERFELIRGGFQAEYGQQSTGVVNIITKSGSNEVEFQYQVTLRDIDWLGSELSDLGSAQENWQGLIGGDYFQFVKREIETGLGYSLATRDDDNNPSPRARIQHQVGVGGPIVLDKVFFYTNLDVLRDDYGSAFFDGELQDDILTYLGKITWEISPQDRFRAELNVRHLEETGSNDIRTPAESDGNFTDGTWTLTFHERHNFTGDEGFFDNATFVEGALSVTHRYQTFRPVVQTDLDETNLFLPPSGAVVYNLQGAGANNDLTYTDYRISSSITKNIIDHTVKVGGEIGYTDFHGTFDRRTTFNDYRLAYGELSIDLADQALSLGQMVNPGPAQEESDSTWQAGLYVQDLWQVTDNLTLEPGLRLDWQEFVDKAYLAPRIGASWDPTGNRRTQLVANWGQFYDNIFLSALTFARQPAVTTYEVFRGPDAVEEFGFAEVPYFRDLVRLALQDVEASAVLVPLATQYFGIDDRLTAPRSTTWSVGLNRVLPKGVRVQANYMERVQDHVAITTGETLRSRDPNEPFTPALQKVSYSTGGGLNVKYKAWTVEMSRAFSNKWGMNASYTQQRATGPVNVPFSTDDPFRFGPQQAVLGRDRTEVIKLGANFDMPWKLSLAANYRYQTGVPVTPVIRQPATTVLGPGLVATRFTASEPLGRNSLRLPPDRALDLTLSRKFKKGDKAYEGRVTVFNITNEYNVYGALALFEPITDPNAGQNLPLRPVILPLFVDVPRSVEFEFRISF